MLHPAAALQRWADEVVIGMKMSSRSDRDRRTVLLATTLLELSACMQLLGTLLANKTVGAVGQVPYFGALLLLLVPAAALLHWPRVSTVLTIGLSAMFAVALLPQQLSLGERLYRLEAEARAIVDYADDELQRTGSPPPNLRGYSFRNPDLESSFRYHVSRKGGYRFSFWVVQPGISHWYDSTTGWGYYDD